MTVCSSRPCLHARHWRCCRRPLAWQQVSSISLPIHAAPGLSMENQMCHSSLICSAPLTRTFSTTAHPWPCIGFSITDAPSVSTQSQHIHPCRAQLTYAGGGGSTESVPALNDRLYDLPRAAVIIMVRLGRAGILPGRNVHTIKYHWQIQGWYASFTKIRQHHPTL